MSMAKSDHRRIIVDTDYYKSGVWHNKQPPRCFEARWLQEPRVEDVVKDAWEREKCNSRKIMQALEQVHGNLHHFYRKVLKKLRKE